MSAIPPDILPSLEEALGEKVVTATPLGGGMVCSAVRARVGSGEVFVKWKPGAPARFFAMEADGLRRLSEDGPLRTPGVIAYRDAEDSAALPFLVLEYIPVSPPASQRALWKALGEGLATMHNEATPPFEAFGLEHPNFLGSQHQNNTPQARWPEFYRECRILPQMEIARQSGLLPPHREDLLHRLIDRFDDLLGGEWARPCLIHGDLWSGNLLTAGDEPVLIDPAVYYGTREMEIAYMQLFSGFHPATFEAYEAVYPLDSGYKTRRPLHQLYPLLIHLNHFGEAQYGGDVDGVCRHYI